MRDATVATAQSPAAVAEGEDCGDRLRDWVEYSSRSRARPMVYLPGGDYWFRGTLKFPAGGKGGLCGDGNSTRLIRIQEPDGVEQPPAIDVGDIAGPQSWRYEFRRFYLLSDHINRGQQNVRTVRGIGIDTDYAQSCVLQMLRIEGFAEGCTINERSAGLLVDKLRITGCRDVCLRVTGGDTTSPDEWLTENCFRTVYVSGYPGIHKPASGVLIEGGNVGDQIFTAACRANHCGVGFRVAGVPGGMGTRYRRNIRLEGLISDWGNDLAIEVRDAADVLIQNPWCGVSGVALVRAQSSSVVGGWFGGDAANPGERDAINLTESDGCIVAGNRIEHWLRGVHLVNSTGCQVTHNSIRHARHSRPMPGGAGVRVVGGRQNIVAGNVIRARAQDRCAYGITVEGSPETEASPAGIFGAFGVRPFSVT